MSIKARGQLGSSRKPGLDPRVAFEISKLVRSIPNITNGTQFPGNGTQFGDMHFYIGEDTTDFKKNNWYIKTTLEEPSNGWQSMNATSLLPGNMQTGTIPAGVVVTDYLSLFGGAMEGVIVFSPDQEIDPALLADGVIPPGVTIAGYVPKTGGSFTGNLDLTDHNISSIKKLIGKDAQVYLELLDAQVTLASDGVIILAAPTLTLSGLTALHLESVTVITFGTDVNLYRSAADTLKTDDTFVAANIAAGANINQDVRSGAAPILAATNFTNYNIVCTDDDVVVSGGEVVYA